MPIESKFHVLTWNAHTKYNYLFILKFTAVVSGVQCFMHVSASETNRSGSAAEEREAMLRWMCAVKPTDVINTQDLRLRLGIDDLDVALRQKYLRWFGHVKQSTSWIGRVCSLDVGGRRSRSRPRKTWCEVLRNGLKLSGLRVEEQNKNHAMSHPRTQWISDTNG